jgi:RNA polymerase sigma factor (sigma-70 family)
MHKEKNLGTVPDLTSATLLSLKRDAQPVAPGMTGPKQRFVEKLFAEHRRALQAYFHRRIRTKSDAPDLAQEVYVRMLRVSDPEVIRNPQLYLYTVASNLVKEHSVLDRQQAGRVDIDDASVQQRLGELPPLDSQLEASEMATRLSATLEQLPGRWRTALILQYRYGLTYQEIADRLGVSANMVKKYLAQGLGHCRRHMARSEGRP